MLTPVQVSVYGLLVFRMSFTHTSEMFGHKTTWYCILNSWQRVFIDNLQ